ncbi:CHAT domain-containing protein [Gammaproteobacteria bacterium]
MPIAFCQCVSPVHYHVIGNLPMNHPQYFSLWLLGLWFIGSFAASAVTGSALEQSIATLQGGQFEQATRHGQAAVAEARDPAQRLDTLLQLAEAYQALGQSRHALATLREAQPLAESLDEARRGALLGALGQALWLTGAADEGRRELEQGIALTRAQAPDIAAAHLNHLGNLTASQGDNRAAREAYRDSLALARQAQDPALIAAVLINQARLAKQTQDGPAAIAPLAEAARLVEDLPASHDKVYHLIALGKLRQNGRDLESAATLARRIDDSRGLYHALGAQAQLEQESGHPREALTLYRQAAFAAQRIEALELLYRWQWPIGRLLKAQGDRDGAILAYQQAVANLRAIRQDFVPRGVSGFTSFRASVGDAFVELTDLLLQRAIQQANPTTREADWLAARDTMEALKTAEVRDYFQDRCASDLQSRTVALGRPQPGTAILYPILLPDRLELLLQSPRGIQSFRVGVNQNTLTGVVREFRQNLEKRTTRQYLPAGQKLHDWLIRPLQGELESIDTLVIVPDGPLRTIPLAALHDAQGFLIERYAIATTPGLTLTDLRPLSRQQNQPLLNGLSEAVQGFPALEYVPGELSAIHDGYGGKMLENQNFLLASVQRELHDTPYSIVHIASHGQFASNVRDSFLLTFDDKLTMDRLERFMGLGQYRTQPVELLTLSACQTAAGDDRAALGLAGVAVKSGARSALATLWFINDQASAKLVTAFYEQLQNPILTKAKALQAAQRQILAESRHQHPYYWSPFLLIGNWL